MPIWPRIWQRLGVALVEQPLPAGEDDALLRHGPPGAGLRRRILP